MERAQLRPPLAVGGERRLLIARTGAAISIRDKHRVLGLELALAANPVCALGQGDGRVLLVMDQRGAAFDLDWPT